MYPHESDIVVRINVAKAEKCGCEFYQTKSNAVLCSQPVPPHCIEEITDYWIGVSLYVRSKEIKVPAGGDSEPSQPASSSAAAKMGMAFIWCVLVVIWVGLGWFGAKWVPYHGQQLASECILSFFLTFHRHAHASYLHTAHVRSSKITPVSPEKTPRFAEKYSPFRTFRFPFRTFRSRFAPVSQDFFF